MVTTTIPEVTKPQVNTEVKKAPVSLTSSAVTTLEADLSGGGARG